ncbi:MAG: HEAT repeat domain-containing protein [Endomicrobiales bacterium]|nr:HEAT repeat domain-containing protein [Endomicrobiales bacterium]
MKRISILALTILCAAAFSAAQEEAVKEKSEQKETGAGQEVAVSTEAAKPDTRTNIEKLSDENPRTRRNAVIYLGSEKKSSNVPHVIRMLKDDDIEVRRAAVNSLVMIGDQRAVKALINRFPKEPNMNARINIVTALGDLKAEAAISLLKKMLKEPYPVFRSEAVRALGKIGSPETYKDVVAMISDEAEGVRVTASQVAGNLGIKAAVQPLVKNLDNPIAIVRKAAVEALAVIGDASARPQIEKLSSDENASVASAAKEALKKLGPGAPRKNAPGQGQKKP